MAAMNPVGRVESVNVSLGGIPKLPLREGELSERGLAGDDWAHPKYHGGPKQALLLISQEHLDELRQLGFSLASGDLGENLTISGLDWEALEAGTELQIGENCRIVLTKLREPCRTLDVYNGAKQGRIQPLLKKSARGGWYARVLTGGVVRPGDTIRVSARLGE